MIILWGDCFSFFGGFIYTYPKLRKIIIQIDGYYF